MVRTIFNIIAELEGQVFAIPVGDGRFFVGQVGKSGDIGILDGTYNAIPKLDEVIRSPLKFRVRFSLSCIRSAKWIRLGRTSFVANLEKGSSYGHRGIDDPKFWRVTFDGTAISAGTPDAEVTREEYVALEPMISYDHRELVERFLTGICPKSFRDGE